MNSWLYGIPNHPFFDQEEKINKIVANIKLELFGYIRVGFHKFKKKLNIDDSLKRCLEVNPLAWDLAVKSIRYGVIYWISRTEAKKYHDYVRKNKKVIDDVAAFLLNDNLSIRLINYAVHCFVIKRRNTIKFSSELIPKLAISSIDQNQLYVRKSDFIDRTPRQSFCEYKALYDLHDFAHIAAATLNSELYGSYYFSSLLYLPADLRNLIKSLHYKTSDANPLSDGVVFSELSLNIFNELNDQNISDEQIFLQIANRLAAYYLNQTPLLHPSTGKFIKSHKVISIYELATLTQNKSYELPAAEIEQKIFTRGGDNGGEDPLKVLKPSERIEFLADCNQALYYEKRNTLRHRAHKEAYKIVANALLPSDKTFVKKIINNIDYKDFYQDRRVDLWQEILKHQRNT